MVQNTISNFMNLTFVLLILNSSVNNYFADHHVGICLYYNAITQDLRLKKRYILVSTCFDCGGFNGEYIFGKQALISRAVMLVHVYSPN